SQSGPGTDPFDIQIVEYTLVCDDGIDYDPTENPDIDGGALVDDDVTLNGNLEVLNTPGGPSTDQDFGPDLDEVYVWQGFMDLPPTAGCTVQLRARDGDGEVICTSTVTFDISTDTTTKVNVLMDCQISYQAPVGMLDLDADFSFNVSNYCPDLFVFNAVDAAPVEQGTGGIPVAATSIEVRFRDADNTCGQSCDPQTCVPSADGLSCTPGPDPGVSTTITCTGGELDCDGDPNTAETECVLDGDVLGVLGGDAIVNASAFVSCVPPSVGGIPGAVITCTAVTTDGDLDCNKTKALTVTCPGLPPCDPSVIDCDDGNPCTVDSCDPSSGIGVCSNTPEPAGTACADASVCSTTPGLCDGAGSCSFVSCSTDTACSVIAGECEVGVCDLACGVCGTAQAADGVSCDVGLGAGSGLCQAGACLAACDQVVCPDSGVPCVSSACNPNNGSCEPAIVADGTSCDPPGGTPGAGTCQAGVCGTTQAAGFCATPLAFDEPLCNPSYDDTLWPGSHRGSYAQGSAAGPGPGPGAVVTPQHIDLPGAPIITSFSEPYADGGRAVWSTVLGPGAPVLKVDHDTFQIVDLLTPEGVNVPLGVSGAYTAVDSDSNFIVGRTQFVSVFGDSVSGDRFSPIELKKRLFFSGTPALCGASDLIAGMALTFDGHIAFATERGNVFVVPLDADQADVDAGLPVISTNPNCDTAPLDQLELVSNSIATDENGGIYVVTSAAMYGFRWDGTALTQEWRVPYDSDPDVSPIRLGPGSGQTPSLMGTAADDDRFVVIADGKALMNLLVIWRDDIPPGWQPIAPGKDPRIACEVPILFGDPSRTEAISEQSIAVRGYSAILVNDWVTNPTLVDPTSLLAPVGQNLVSALEAGVPAKAPTGMERVDWDPVTQTCSTIWANPTVVIPNGIPSISAETNLVYGIGLRGAQWGVEGLDFDTGASVVWAPGGTGACDPDAISLPRAFFADVDALLSSEIIPGSGITVDQTACENSLYAATTVGPGGAIYTGTFYGMSKYTPDLVPPASDSVRARAGVQQAIDLLQRADTSFAAGEDAEARDFVGRALRQTDAAIVPAFVTGPESASNDVIAANASTRAALVALDAALDPATDIAQALALLDSAASQLN
ncbi:MAG: hypothetical protein AAF997_07380, partial [Myxococcota bacterium]